MTVRRALIAMVLAAAMAVLRVALGAPRTATVEQAQVIEALASEVGEVVPDVRYWSRHEADSLILALRCTLSNPDAAWRHEALR